MGVVYRATQLSLNRVAALKVLAAEFSEDPAFRERFRREGQLQAAIDHPHIVTVYEAGETEHGLFLAMRVVKGPTLKDLILAKELDEGRTLRVLTQVADALDAAHDVGLIHRDVKPQNILLDTRDNAYLADFGLTKAPGESGLTEEGQFVGTIDYVSPEQARGEPATNASDVYALAGVLCECLTGEVPFPRQAEAAVLFAHLTEPAPRLSEQRPDLPAALDDVVARGMAKDPNSRPRSATDLMAEAARALPHAAASAAAAADDRGDPSTRHRRPGVGGSRCDRAGRNHRRGGPGRGGHTRGSHARVRGRAARASFPGRPGGRRRSARARRGRRRPGREVRVGGERPHAQPVGLGGERPAVVPGGVDAPVHGAQDPRHDLLRPPGARARGRQGRSTGGGLGERDRAHAASGDAARAPRSVAQGERPRAARIPSGIPLQGSAAEGRERDPDGVRDPHDGRRRDGGVRHPAGREGLVLDRLRAASRGR